MGKTTVNWEFSMHNFSTCHQLAVLSPVAMAPKTLEPLPGPVENR